MVCCLSPPTPGRGGYRTACRRNHRSGRWLGEAAPAPCGVRRRWTDRRARPGPGGRGRRGGGPAPPGAGAGPAARSGNRAARHARHRSGRHRCGAGVPSHRGDRTRHGTRRLARQRRHHRTDGPDRAGRPGPYADRRDRAGRMGRPGRCAAVHHRPGRRRGVLRGCAQSTGVDHTTRPRTRRDPHGHPPPAGGTQPVRPDRPPRLALTGHGDRSGGRVPPPTPMWRSWWSA